MRKGNTLLLSIMTLIMSLAAAATGTVAWFTANLKANVASEQINIIKASSDLNIEVVGDALYGTSASGKTDKNGDNLITSTGRMLDGSVDLLAGTPNISPIVYVPVLDTKSYSVIDPYFVPWVPRSGEDIFRLRRYTINFSKDFTHDANGIYGVFINPELLASTPVVNNGASKAENSLRVGIVCGSNVYIWAPYNENGANYHYVNADLIASITKQTNIDEIVFTANQEYTNDRIVRKTDSKPVLYETGNEKLFLDELTKQSPTFAATIYTWFESVELTDDDEIVSDYGYTLAFNAVRKTGV